MTSRARALAAMAAMATAAATVLMAAPPPVQNGRVETRPALTIARAVGTLGGADPIWIGWHVPMVSGDRNLCSTWTNDETSVRGARLEPASNDATPPAFARPPSPLPIDAGSDLVVLARVVGTSVERIRVVTGDCPLDAGGRAFYWLSDATPADSLHFLDDLATKTNVADPATRGTATAAVRAIGLHQDQMADAILDRLTGDTTDRTLRGAAVTALESRGAHGFARLTALAANESNADMRRAIVTAIAHTWEPGAAAALLQFSRTDTNASVRGEALYQYGMREGQPGTAAVLAAVKTDPDDQVKRRGVSAIAALPADAGTPILIDLARSTSNVAVRRAAVSALGNSKDERARRFIEEIIQN